MLTPDQNRRFKEINWRLVGILGKLLVDFIFRTGVIEIKGQKPLENLMKSRKYIIAIWHSRIMLFSYFFKGMNGSALVSRSDDGEIIARILQAQGHETVRGSTSKGGLRAMSKLIKDLKNKRRPGAIIPDGPRGPRFQVQPGVIMLAKKTGYPIIPATYSAKKIKVFSSWDRFVLPYPFTRCRMVFGKPIPVSPDADPV
ncbi:MAG: lysophospholipid acyltransferase family protein, partial [Desulfobacterales bacterium]|nr:lysophospholipid acyltransferase family protein [Desulfobacterales bacterium]